MSMNRVEKDEVQPIRRTRLPVFNEIRLRNFKSITQATIPLHGLTVIVGANSAGKSTLLQAMLVLAQAARTELSSRRLPLNGEFVLLGEFQEVQSFGADTDEGFSIGLSAHVSPSEPHHPAAFSRRQDGLAQLSWNGHFAEPENPYSGHADLKSFDIALVDEFGKPLCSIDVASVIEDAQETDESRNDDPMVLFRGPRLRVDGRLSDHRDQITRQIQSSRLSGGIPRSLYGVSTPLTLIVDEWWKQWCDSNTHEWVSLREEHRRSVGSFESPLSTQAQNAAVIHASKLIQESKELQSLFSTSGEIPIDPRRLVSHVIKENLLKCSDKKRKSILVSMTSLGPKTFSEQMETRLIDFPWLKRESIVEIRHPEGAYRWDLGIYFRGGFRSLKYLGPIREAPRVTYDPSPGRNDIGVRGEYAAAVLNSQYLHQVKCPLPRGGVSRMPLGEALDIWLSEFGLATHAQSRDLGRRGMSLSVVPREGAREVDLTSVGVGVSQVMPVILLCLLSRPSSVVILEQPELHLHPAMQLKLADFFLACRRMGLQIILETHSEHLVNRLRRRVAEDDSDTLRHEIGLLFAEQEDGVSRYRSTSINEYGALSGDWPAGFLDVGTDEAGEFLQGALRRRNRVTADQVDDDI